MLAHKKKLKFNATKVQMYSLKYYILIYFIISHIFYYIYCITNFKLYFNVQIGESCFRRTNQEDSNYNQ